MRYQLFSLCCLYSEERLTHGCGHTVAEKKVSYDIYIQLTIKERNVLKNTRSYEMPFRPKALHLMAFSSHLLHIVHYMIDRPIDRALSSERVSNISSFKAAAAVFSRHNIYQ